MLPLNEEDEKFEDEPPLKWSMMKQRGSKGKKIIDICVKAFTLYTAKGSEKKFLASVIKASNSLTTIRRILKKANIVGKKNFDIVEVV